MDDTGRTQTTRRAEPPTSEEGAQKFGYAPGEEVTYYDLGGRRVEGERLAGAPLAGGEAKRRWVEAFREAVEAGLEVEEAREVADRRVPGP